MNLKVVKLVTALTAVGWTYFLSFKILEHISATELMWFLYWGAIPLAVFLAILQALVDE